MTKRKPSKPTPHGTLNGYKNYGCRCDECKAAMSAAMRAYNAADPERNRAKARAWQLANPDQYKARRDAYTSAHKEEQSIRKKAHYAANRERMVADAIRWKRDNPDRARATRRKWKQANPEKDRAHVELRRARKAASDVRVVTIGDWERMVARHRGCCAYCGRPGKLTQDHVIPISRGGRHSVGNLVPACGVCNSSKGSKLLVEWRRRATPLDATA